MSDMRGACVARKSLLGGWSARRGRCDQCVVDDELFTGGHVRNADLVLGRLEAGSEEQQGRVHRPRVLLLASASHDGTTTRSQVQPMDGYPV